MDNTSLNSLIDYLYDAAIGEVPWAGVAGRLASTFESGSAVLKIQSVSEKVQLLDVTDNLVVKPSESAWADFWHSNDLWVARSVAFGRNRIVTDRDLMPRKELLRTGFYWDWLRYLGIAQMLGAVIDLGHDELAVLGVHRDIDGPDYDASDRQRLDVLIPHLKRAVKLRRSLAGHAMGTVGMVDAVTHASDAMMIVDKRCRIHFTNPAALHLLQSHAGLSAQQGHLTTRRAESMTRIRSAIIAACATPTALPATPIEAVAMDRENQLPLLIYAMPLHRSPSKDQSERMALLLLRDPRHVGPDLALLRKAFGFTHTEVAVAGKLTDGKSPEDIATEMKIGLGTVRTHLKSLFAKTGTRRQGQLVALLLRATPLVRQT